MIESNHSEHIHEVNICWFFYWQKGICVFSLATFCRVILIEISLNSRYLLFGNRKLCCHYVLMPSCPLKLNAFLRSSRSNIKAFLLDEYICHTSYAVTLEWLGDFFDWWLNDIPKDKRNKRRRVFAFLQPCRWLYRCRGLYGFHYRCPLIYSHVLSGVSLLCLFDPTMTGEGAPTETVSHQWRQSSLVRCMCRVVDCSED